MIAQSFYQKKICLLPGIGTLELTTQPAVTDFVNGKIVAPIQQINFNPQQHTKPIFNEFSAISAVLIDEMKSNGQVLIDGLGIFSYTDAAISFEATILAQSYTPAVTAIRVQRENATHDILVGDKQTTTVQMTEFYAEDEQTTKKYWWVWALVLALVSVGAIGYYWYTYGFNFMQNVH